MLIVYTYIQVPYEMNLKQYITTGYGAGIYKLTTKLKEAKKSKAKAKNQLIFLEKCIKHKLIPKSFQVKVPVRSKNANDILKKFRADLLICAKNEAKKRFFKQVRTAQEIHEQLTSVINEEDMIIINNVTNKAHETMFKKAKERLLNKFEYLKSKTKSMQGQKYVKNPVLNLVDNEIPKHHQELLGLGPKFIPNVKRIPYMDIISTTESSSLKLEFGNKIREAQTLRKDVLRILKMAKPIKDNLTRDQRIAMNEIKKDERVSIYPFDKGGGLVRINTDDAISKVREQISNTKIIKEDPTPAIARKIKKVLSELKKLRRFTTNEYEELYPSDPLPPRMYGTVKAHKPEKNYPMRIVVSTIGTATYGISNYLVRVSQNTLNKNSTRIRNSQSLAEEAKTWNISPDEIQVSY